MGQGIVIIISVILICIFLVTHHYCYPENLMYKKIEVTPLSGIHDIELLFALTPGDIPAKVKVAIKETQAALDALVAIKSSERTWQNTPFALDRITDHSRLALLGNVLSTIEYLHPDVEMRDAAHNALEQIQLFLIDAISNNKKLYEAFKSYVEEGMLQEKLSASQQLFITEKMEDFMRAGLALSDEVREKLALKKKELAQLSLQFSRAIADDQTKVRLLASDLDGLSAEWIATLARDDNYYVVGLDYPTYSRIMEQCKVEETRKVMSRAFNNRAYPGNELLLKSMMALRNEIAQMVGYSSYAAYDLADKMVRTPERAQEFLDDLIQRVHEKVWDETNILARELPESVTLNEQGLIKPWDISFVINEYKKRYFDIDEQKIAEYFPMEKTIESLFAIYRKFFSLDFVIEPSIKLWHSDVQLISVYTADHKEHLGYLLLDLYPRPFKFSHAAQLGVLPALKIGGVRIPGLAVVMANFPRSTVDQPSLLKRSDVKTFFHEFGHALHTMLGATELASQAGTCVKRDFVELPSQILEEWLHDPEILKQVSCHYKTEESLPDNVITNIIALRQFTSGIWIQRQIILAKMALAYFGPQAENQDPYEIMVALYQQYGKNCSFDPESHFYCSFDHLTDYGASYYGYLWSQVFALDIFGVIASEDGLLDARIGKRYADAILIPGGSMHPDQLLRNFLGREPQNNTFLESFGLVHKKKE